MALFTIKKCRFIALIFSFLPTAYADDHLTTRPPPEHVIRTGMISSKGPDNWLAATPLFGCIADTNDICAASGRFLILQNTSTGTKLHWSSKATCTSGGYLETGQTLFLCLRGDHVAEGKETPLVEVTVEFDEQ